MSEPEYIDYEWTWYWCPSEEKESSCPGPCPDGQEHYFHRIEVTRARVVPQEISAKGYKAVAEWMKRAGDEYYTERR